MEDLARRLGVSYHPDPLIFPKAGQPGSADSIRINDEQLWQLVEQQNWVNIDAGIITNDPGKALLCSGGRTRCAISPHGEVFPCALWRIPLGDLRQHTFKEVWHSEAANRVRAVTVNDFPMCTKCALVHYCTRCPGMVYMENSSISGPSLENCRMACAIKGVKDSEEQETVHKSRNRVRTD